MTIFCRHRIIASKKARSGLLSTQTTEAITIAIHGNTWQYSSPQHPPRTLQLTGFKPIAPTWQNQADSITMMLIQASQNQVDVQFLTPDSPLALVRLS